MASRVGHPCQTARQFYRQRKPRTGGIRRKSASDRNILQLSVLQRMRPPEPRLKNASWRGNCCKSYKFGWRVWENFTFLGGCVAGQLSVRTVLLGTFRYHRTRCAIGRRVFPSGPSAGFSTRFPPDATRYLRGQDSTPSQPLEPYLAAPAFVGSSPAQAVRKSQA